MSRATIRAAIVTWLSPPNVDGINTVYRGSPTIIPGTAFFDPAVPGRGSGCVACVNIGRATETRVAMGGAHGGWKRVDHQVSIQLFYRNVRPAGLRDDKGLEATDEFDAIVDHVKTRIRADRTASSSAIWQWGEASLDCNVGEQKLTNLGIDQWAAITTIATEWLPT